MPRLDDPWHEQQTSQRNGAHPEKHLHGGCQSIRAHRSNSADDERADCGNDATRVVTKAGAGGSQSSGKQLGKVVRERSEDAENREADEEISVEAIVRWKIQSERRHHRDTR